MSMGFSNSLDRLGIYNNTDKSSLGRFNPASKAYEGAHSYLFAYEHFLSASLETAFKLRPSQPFRLLELGAGPLWNVGASAKAFRDFLPKSAEIFVAEIDPMAEQPLCDIGVTSIICDLGDPAAYTAFKQFAPYDFIIDDASHQWAHQHLSLACLWPYLVDTGTYIIEDLVTSFGLARDHHNNTSLCPTGDPFSSLILLSTHLCGRNQLHPLHKLLADTHLSADILTSLASITFLPDAAVLQKKSATNPYLHYH